MSAFYECKVKKVLRKKWGGHKIQCSCNFILIASLNFCLLEGFCLLFKPDAIRLQGLSVLGLLTLRRDLNKSIIRINIWRIGHWDQSSWWMFVAWNCQSYSKIRFNFVGLSPFFEYHFSHMHVDPVIIFWPLIGSYQIILTSDWLLLQ